MTGAPTTLADFTVAGADGAPLPLARYAGQVVLIVNVASRCGFTPQYAGLQALQQEFAPYGFTVLAFPCNQFGHQEPGSDAEITEFCALNYQVSFPVLRKIDVNGARADPLFRWLRQQKGGLLTDAIKWNFTKFLIGRDGRVLRRAPPTTAPEARRCAIAEALRVAAPAGCGRAG